jgi:hypothetical protein
MWGRKQRYIQDGHNPKTSENKPFFVTVDATLGLNEAGNVVSHCNPGSIFLQEPVGADPVRVCNPFNSHAEELSSDRAMLCITSITPVYIRSTSEVPIDMRLDNIFSVGNKASNYSFLNDNGPEDSIGGVVESHDALYRDKPQISFKGKFKDAPEITNEIHVRIPAMAPGVVEMPMPVYKSIVPKPFQLLCAGLEGGYKVNAAPVIRCDENSNEDIPRAWRQLISCGYDDAVISNVTTCMYKMSDPIYHVAQRLAELLPDDERIQISYQVLSGQGTRMVVPSHTDAFIRSFMSDTVYDRIRYTDFSMTRAFLTVDDSNQSRFNATYRQRFVSHGVGKFVPFISVTLKVESVHVMPGVPAFEVVALPCV